MKNSKPFSVHDEIVRGNGTVFNNEGSDAFYRCLAASYQLMIPYDVSDTRTRYSTLFAKQLEDVRKRVAWEIDHIYKSQEHDDGRNPKTGLMVLSLATLGASSINPWLSFAAVSMPILYLIFFPPRWYDTLWRGRAISLNHVFSKTLSTLHGIQSAA